MAEDASSAAHPPIYTHRSIPRRTCDAADSPTHVFSQVTPPTAHEAGRASDFLAQLNARLLRTYDARELDGDEPESEPQPPPRNKSFLNMTSSTLFGIYDGDVADGAAGDRGSAETPWGTGAETPVHAAHAAVGMPTCTPGMGGSDAGLSLMSRARGPSPIASKSTAMRSHTATTARQGPWRYAVLVGKLAALYLFGATYGFIVSQLHETRQLAAVHVEGVDRRSRVYLASWGLFGLVLGSLLPYVDLVWATQTSHSQTRREQTEQHDSPISEQINDVVRSVCAFVGIAFAIRRLPWQSTLQLTLTLALVNPALWYILDRSKPGLSFSLVVTSVLTSFIFLSNPNALPSPPLPSSTNIAQLSLSPSGSSSESSTSTSTSGQLFAGVVSYESLAVVTWVGSVLFCSCVCFGNIGRRLGVLDGPVFKR